MAECNRCGKCCTISVNGKWRDCEYLRKNNKQTTCTIYGKHVGRTTGVGQYCTERKFSKYDYPDCPYNNKRQIHPAYITERKIVDSVTVMELQMRKWNDNTEDLGVICPGKLIEDSKIFLLKILTKAMNIVMDAQPRESIIKKGNIINKQIFRSFINKARKR